MRKQTDSNVFFEAPLPTHGISFYYKFRYNRNIHHLETFIKHIHFSGRYEEKTSPGNTCMYAKQYNSGFKFRHKNRNSRTYSIDPVNMKGGV